MELADLRAFVRITDVGSLSGAARALRIPKSSVSRSLARLEDSMGAALVERSTRHLRLTDAGQVLRGHARRILNDVEQAEDAVTGLAGAPRGDLKITAPFTFAVGPVAAMMPAFLDSHPEIRISVSIDNKLVDVVAEEYDLAIRIGELADSELIAKRLATIDMWLCGGTDYLVRSGPLERPADLAGHRLISYGHGPEPWRFRDAGGILAKLPLAARIAVEEPDAILALIAGGAGIGLLPEFTAAPAVAQGRAVRLFADLDFGSVPAHAIYSSHRSMSPKVRAFVDALADHLSRG